MKSIIARNIKRIIEESGYKQAAIAKKAGYTPGLFSNMLNGRVLPILWWIAPKLILFYRFQTGGLFPRFIISRE